MSQCNCPHCYIGFLLLLLVAVIISESLHILFNQYKLQHLHNKIQHLINLLFINNSATNSIYPIKQFSSSTNAPHNPKVMFASNHNDDVSFILCQFLRGQALTVLSISTHVILHSARH